MNILDLLTENQIAPKKVAQDEYSSPCPACGGSDRFRSWPQKDRFWCRGCGEKGDSIQYLRTFKGMTYFEACEHLGREPKAPFSAGDARPSKPKWEPKQPQEPAALWQEQATKLVEYSVSQLWSPTGKGALEWLRTERGFTDETIRAFRLGWNPKDFWRNRSTWGLPVVLKENGKPKKLWIPEGLVIPSGALSRIKIRRPEPGDGPRYYLLPGSNMQAMTCGSDTSVLVVVESELDAVLIHQEAGNRVGSIALGSSVMRPDSVTADVLRSAELILVALDSDEAGAKEAWRWWGENFPEARRWPPVGGKDPGEMRQAGISIFAWVEAGIEEYSDMAQPEQQSLSTAKKGHRTFGGEATEATTCTIITGIDPAPEHPATYDGEVWEAFCGFVALLTRNPALWPNVRRYAERELPRELFNVLAEEYSQRFGTPGQVTEWQSPYPARCADCLRQAGCKRAERITQGLQCRHDCSEFEQKGQTNE